jgi:hypothetical protein
MVDQLFRPTQLTQGGPGALDHGRWTAKICAPWLGKNAAQMVLNMPAGASPTFLRAAQDRQVLKARMLMRQSEEFGMEEQRLHVLGAENQLDAMLAIFRHE